MFSVGIQNTVFQKPTTPSGFCGVSCSGGNMIDDSFVSTVRALLADKDLEGGSLSLRIFHNQATYQLFDLTAKNILWVSTNAGGRDDYWTTYKDSLTNAGFHEVEKVQLFFSNTFKASCFVNEELKSTVVFAWGINVATFHYLQCAVPVFMPWIFNEEHKLSAEELDLIESLRRNSAEAYIRCLDKIAEITGRRDESVRLDIMQFETSCVRQEIENAKAEISCMDTDIRQFNTRIAEILKRKIDKQVVLMGLEEKVKTTESEDSELLEFFTHNKSISVNRVVLGSLIFECRGYFEYYDEELAERVIHNPDSSIYDEVGKYGYDLVRRLMELIFLERKIKVKVCAAFDLNIANRILNPLQHFEYSNTSINHMPNPHLDEYACLGGYTVPINELMSDGDYVGVVSQCIASCGNLNFGDSVVMELFMKRLLRGSSTFGRIFELPDGTSVKIKKAMEWVREQEGECAQDE